MTPQELPPDRRMEWLERSAIMEFDGGLPRSEADARALEMTLAEMRGERQNRLRRPEKSGTIPVEVMR